MSNINKKLKLLNIILLLINSNLFIISKYKHLTVIMTF